MIPQIAVALKSNNRICYLGSMMVKMWRDHSFLTSVQQYDVLSRCGFHYIGVGSQRHTFSMVFTDVFQLYADDLGRWNFENRDQSEVNMPRFEGPGTECCRKNPNQKTSRYARVIDSFVIVGPSHSESTQNGWFPIVASCFYPFLRPSVGFVLHDGGRIAEAEFLAQQNPKSISFWPIFGHRIC